MMPSGIMDLSLPLVQVMAWCQIGTKPLPEPMLSYGRQDTQERNSHEKQQCDLHGWHNKNLPFLMAFILSSSEWVNPYGAETRIF